MALDQKLFSGHPGLGSAKLHIPIQGNPATGPTRLCVVCVCVCVCVFLPCELIITQIYSF